MNVAASTVITIITPVVAYERRVRSNAVSKLMDQFFNFLAYRLLSAMTARKGINDLFLSATARNGVVNFSGIIIVRIHTVIAAMLSSGAFCSLFDAFDHDFQLALQFLQLRIIKQNDLFMLPVNESVESFHLPIYIHEGGFHFSFKFPSFLGRGGRKYAFRQTGKRQQIGRAHV